MSLTEYSAKYGVSVSTLRRKIKKSEILHDFDGVKYWLEDTPLSNLIHEVPVTFLGSNSNFKAESVDPNFGLQFDGPSLSDLISEVDRFDPEDDEAIYLEKRRALNPQSPILDELKSAYDQNLKTKDQMIQQLQEQIVDLKTLNKVYESELKEVTNQSKSRQIIDY